MADLLQGPATTNGNGAGSSRPTAAPQPTGSPSIRGPRVIMRERQAREARRAEEERMQRDREHNQRVAERHREAERLAQSIAGAAPTGTGEPSQRRQTTSEAQGRPARAQQAVTTPSAPTGPQGPIPALRQRAGTTGEEYAPAQTGTPGHIQPSAGQRASGAPARSSFPHAFERWEALSAHWEGLTSFWIRKLEQNSAEIDRDAIGTQLSRQVTDLSAAGANLFHALVELQRLRSSSERKFQRWFIETRAEIERQGEMISILKQALDEERDSRDSNIAAALQNERDNSVSQKQLSEMKKELAISKEEARRAWDELGRREQEERDRVSSLNSGLPVVIGGIQVVPMTQGVPSRHGSQREGGQYGEYPAQPPTTTAAPLAGGQGYYAQPGAPGGSGAGGGSSAGGEGSEGGYSEDYEAPAASYPPQSTAYTTAPDYSGQAYAEPAWDAPRHHHHPTRLSDVPEEDDERSRTSAGNMSRSNHP